ncbi:hypothetical protein G7054_g15037 [Neopestalotiopsis clavispora]|nr:hypothetical protein G7054_g15037 [Neopestalotiopsis clavispora]
MVLPVPLPHRLLLQLLEQNSRNATAAALPDPAKKAKDAGKSAAAAPPAASAPSAAAPPPPAAGTPAAVTNVAALAAPVPPAAKKATGKRFLRYYQA